MYAKIAE